MRIDEETVKRALDGRLAPLRATPERQTRICAAAMKKEEPIVKKKMTAGFVLGIALVVALAGVALAVGESLFARFAQRDTPYQGVLDQVTTVTEAPTTVQDEALGTARAYVDSAYYDGETLTLVFAVEHAHRAVLWMPDEGELAQMTPAEPDEAQPLAETEEERTVTAAYQQAKEARKPAGMRLDDVWVHDHFYTEGGVDLPPYSGDDAVDEDGTWLEFREFSPLPAEAVGQDSLTVCGELGRTIRYYYFDGQQEWTRFEVIREGVGKITATVPRSEARRAVLKGTGMLNGAACTVTAQVSALEMRLTVTADGDVFRRTERQMDGTSWMEQPWMAAAYDEKGTAYSARESASADADDSFTVMFDGTGSLPETIRVYVYQMGETEPSEEEIQAGPYVELMPQG